MASIEVSMDEVQTRYHGRTERCALVFVDDEAYPLAMADTARAARDIEAATSILRAIAVRAGVPASAVISKATTLQAHCRKLTRFRPDIKRDRPRPRLQRVSL